MWICIIKHWNLYKPELKLVAIFILNNGLNMVYTITKFIKVKIMTLI